jgi:hypothetical protein
VLGEGALGALEDELVGAVGGVDSSHMLQVFRSRDKLEIKMSSKKMSTKWWRMGRRTSFINAWNVEGMLDRLKDITTNLKCP